VESYGDATVSNGGLLTGSAYGVTFRGTGSVTNAAGGTISGFYDGIRAVNAAATVTNDGSIDGPQNYAIRLGANGVIVNTANGRLTGGSDGVLFDGVNASFNNAGFVFGAGTYRATIGSGAYLSNGGMVTNTGILSGKLFGVGLRRPGTVNNAGLITGATGISMAGTAGTSATLVNSGTIVGTAAGTAVKFAAGDDRLVLGQGAVFTGNVDGGAGTNILEFATGGGTLSGLGTSVLNFPSLVFDAGASWTAAGNAAGLSGLISGFAAGDAIDITGLNETGKFYSNGTLTLTGDATVNLQLPGAFTAESFVLTPDGAGGTGISLACFAAGTRLATSRGLVPVEQLSPGDQVLAREAGMCPIVWIGHRRVDCLRHSRPEEVCPVRVRAGAFGSGVPARDVLLSPDHAVFVDDVLIPIRHLIDGAAVVQEALESITYYHVELPAHDIVLADGLSCESYLDTGNRAGFANGGPVILLQPGFAAARREGMSCAPLVITGPVLDATRQRLSFRACIDNELAMARAG
jgi:collagen type I/II/III/V/XI/XXIV/XXVII alpha